MNLTALSDSELLESTRIQVRRAQEVDADLLLLLGEVEDRRLFLGRAYNSMFTFCVGEFGFSEDVTVARLIVARLARRFPVVLDYLRDGRIHLTGLKLLAPVINAQNLDEVLARATGKSKRKVEELVVAYAPRPPVADSIRRVPQRAEPAPSVAPSTDSDTPLVLVPTPPRPVRTFEPLTPETVAIRFTATTALRDKLDEAKDLLRHSVPGGDLAAILEQALDLLIEKTKKERFGVGRKPAPKTTPPRPPTRHIPLPTRREVYERDGGRCTFVSADGKHCCATDRLEFDHLDGFARVKEHRADRITLRCRAHNQYGAELMYGADFMAAAREGCKKVSAPGRVNSAVNEDSEQSGTNTVAAG